MKSKLMYWLVNSPDEAITKKIRILEAINFQVRLVASFDELIIEFNKARSSIILISDQIEPITFKNQLVHLCSKPEFSGVRLISITTRSDKNLAKLATTLNFKDIIPLNLKPEKYWLERFKFATGTKDYTKPPPDYQLTIHNIAALRAPARLTWIGKDSMLIETKLNIPIGSKLRIETELTQLSGEKGIQAIVKERKSSNLRYRFSDAYLCEISREQGTKILEYLKSTEVSDTQCKRPIKIFAAIKSAKIRKRLEQTLSPDLYDLNFALRKNSILTEPSYIKPDLILLDFDIVKLPDDSFIQQLSECSPPECKIVFLQSDQTGKKTNKHIPTLRQKIHFLGKQLDTILHFIGKQSEAIDVTEVGNEVVYLPKIHTLSRLLIRVPARITKLHPETLSIATPFEIGKFNLALVESPLFTANFDRNVVVKIVGSFENKDPQTREFQYINKALISDLNTQERLRLSTEILELLENHVLRHHFEESATRKIERAIVKAKPTTPDKASQPSVYIKPKAKQKMSTLISKRPIETVPEVHIKAKPVEEEKQAIKKDLYTPRKRSKKNDKHIFYTILFLLCFIVGIAILLREPPQDQGKVFSDSYKRYYEKTKGIKSE